MGSLQESVSSRRPQAIQGGNTVLPPSQLHGPVLEGHALGFHGLTLTRCMNLTWKQTDLSLFHAHSFHVYLFPSSFFSRDCCPFSHLPLFMSKPKHSLEIWSTIYVPMKTGLGAKQIVIRKSHMALFMPSSLKQRFSTFSLFSVFLNGGWGGRNKRKGRKEKIYLHCIKNKNTWK